MQYNWYIFPLFDAWLDSTGAIPDIYWNVYSEEQRYKFLCCRLQKLVEYAEKMGLQLNLQGDALNELAEKLSFFETPEYYNDHFRKIIEQWISTNLEYIYEHTIKQIYFALDDSGYLVAYIPDSWSDISFFTSLDYSNQSEYGHLQLIINTD